MNENWKNAVDKSILDSSRELSTLDQDVGARFNGLNAVVQSLGDQVSDLAEYANSVPDTRVAFAQAFNWPTPNSWRAAATVNMVIPSYPCLVNVYAAAHAHVWSQKIPGTSDDQFANGRSRIRVAGVNSSTEVFGLVVGPDGNERWALGNSHATIYRAVGGTLSVSFDIINPSNANSAGTDAGLAVIATFMKAM